MTEEQTAKVLEGYYSDVIDDARKVEEKNIFILEKYLKPKLSKNKYNDVLEFLSESGDYELIGVVLKNKVFGHKQDESGYLFKHIFITQDCGMTGDDFSGTIFIPLNKTEYLKFTYSM